MRSERRSPVVLRLLVVLWVACLFTGVRLSQAAGNLRPGNLDSEFGDQGKVRLNIGGGWASAVAVAIDGKILVAGFSSGGSGSDFALARFDFTGQPDPTFGQGGRVTTDFNGQNDQAYALALQPGGKILVGGKSISAASDPSLPDADFALARFNPNGRLDPAFGLGGRVTLDFGISDEIAGIVVQPDGKILAAGDSLQRSSGQIALARFNPDGSLDRGFGSGGQVITPVGQAAPDVNALLLQPDGKLLVGGSALYKVNTLNGGFVARYLPSGQLDPTFGQKGVALLSDEGRLIRVNSLALQEDGKIIAAGTNSDERHENLLVVRLNQDGSPDDRFGDDGKVVTDLNGAHDFAYAVQIQADGKLLVAGHVSPPVSATVDFLVTRYLPDGRLDNSFGLQGASRVDFGADDYGYAMAMYGDGRLVLAGRSGGSSYNFALARIRNDTPHYQPRIWFPLITH